MFKYEKILQYPIDIKNKDLKMAKIIITQYGGANGELAAALRYLTQRYTMPDEKGRALLTDIGVEELGHVEMIATMVHQLTKSATPNEIKTAGLEGYYSEHGLSLYPVNGDGAPFTITYVSSTGDAVADLSENMAAEEKARAVYENLINLATDPEVIAPLQFLRQREIIHFHRFKELYKEYKAKAMKE